MFLRANKRFKDSKKHRYWSVVENRRIAGGRSVQKTLLYLGEINDSDRAGWTRAIEAVDERYHTRQIHLFPEDRTPDPRLEHPTLKLRLEHIELARPRQWGGCWLALELWNRLDLDTFWQPLLPDSQKGTPWFKVLKTLVVYRLLDPGSEWRLHRSWLDRSAMADLLDDDFRLAAKDTLYRCHGHLLVHREALITHLKDRWAGLFGACYDILLYDLTSTYFEVDANGPVTEASRLKAFGYSRDKRPDCVQIVIALIVTPDGLPIGYEVMRGNTSDKTTLAGMLKTITDRYGKERRTWIMDRGIPTEETLHQMRQADPSVRYLVGTPKDRLTKLEKDLATKDWQQVKDDVHVKLLHRDGELYVLARSLPRRGKESAMRRKKLGSLLGAPQRTPKARQTHPRRTAPRHRRRQTKSRAQRPPTRHPSSSRIRRASCRRRLPPRTRSQQTQSHPPPRRPVSASQQPNRRRPRRTLAQLHQPRAHRRKLPHPQRRPRAASHLSPTRRTHRSPHLHQLPRLLPAQPPPEIRNPEPVVETF